MLRFIYLVLFVITSLGTAKADRMNVLFIAADDLRCDLGCYGHKIVKTPHLDRLSQRGIRFDRAYCAQALCNPSRSSLMTGHRPDTLQQYNLAKHFRDAIPDVVTLPQFFKQQGYFTQNIGKIFHNWRTEIQGDPISWSTPAVMHFDSHRNDEAMVDGKLAIDHANAIRCECRDVPDNAYFDGRITDLAINALQERSESNKPFFLALGFWKPHLPFNAPKQYWDLYDRSKIPLSSCQEWPTDTPRIAWHNSQELLGKSKPAKLSEDDQRELHHGYLAAISYMDAQVGRVLAELDRLRLAENTLIVFWSDHGFQLGDHTLWCKTSNFELDARVPMMIVPPNGSARKESDAIVELLDLYPTIVDLCGFSVPDELEGVSLKPLIQGQVDSVKSAALTQHPRPSYYGNAMKAMGHSARTERFRYTEWRSTESSDEGTLIGAELYDHDIDPMETVNRVGDPNYQLHVQQHKMILNTLAGNSTASKANRSDNP